ncbi:TetR/AcrR family transcriptional regulator [Caldichromatium japonicum]|uniref:TetR/AcrR family transcriptional regulator n=1 Tax=Caldichromatium japonicum TaxID=2699430 RepID=A0A6G7V9T4_9GAMM|nr:TetR/AcrR family transcriptional regulator [Caldichromatium japonicum]QIK36781.1 TetR/AcrR family transcriptional regulator [Caldichromatium japonicum]
MSQTETELSRGEIRRRQILDAAARCFAQDGFHATSIATLSKATGMSPGHIYHFFANKEAIIGALIERKLAYSLQLVEQFEDAEDLFQALVERVELGLNEKTNLANAALELEILAEAARNPGVAASLRAADQIKRQRLMELIGQARRGRSQEEDPERDIAASTELLMALFDGLAVRAISHPDIDRAALIPLLQKAVATLIEG